MKIYVFSNDHVDFDMMSTVSSSSASGGTKIPVLPLSDFSWAPGRKATNNWSTPSLSLNSSLNSRDIRLRVEDLETEDMATKDKVLIVRSMVDRDSGG